MTAIKDSAQSMARSDTRKSSRTSFNIATTSAALGVGVIGLGALTFSGKSAESAEASAPQAPALRESVSAPTDIRNDNAQISNQRVEESRQALEWAKFFETLRVVARQQQELKTQTTTQLQIALAQEDGANYRAALAQMDSHPASSVAFSRAMESTASVASRSASETARTMTASNAQIHIATDRTLSNIIETTAITPEAIASVVATAYGNPAAGAALANASKERKNNIRAKGEQDATSSESQNPSPSTRQAHPAPEEVLLKSKEVAAHASQVPPQVSQSSRASNPPSETPQVVEASFAAPLVRAGKWLATAAGGWIAGKAGEEMVDDSPALAHTICVTKERIGQFKDSMLCPPDPMAGTMPTKDYTRMKQNREVCLEKADFEAAQDIAACDKIYEKALEEKAKRDREFLERNGPIKNGDKRGDPEPMP